METSQDAPLAIFRPGIKPIATTLAGVVGIVIAACAPLALWKGMEFERFLGAIVLGLGGVLVLAPLLALVVRPYGIHVHSGGIAGRDFWGRRCFVQWREIVELRSDNTSGLTFLVVVSGTSSGQVWTRPDVIRNPEFQRLASSLADPGHPLLIDAELAA